MKINNVMHVSFFTDKMDEMIAFYCEKLGCKVKVLTRYKAYLDRDDRPAMQAIAQKDPERIFSVYLEIAPGQFVEFFPKGDGQLDRDDTPWNGRLGYSHFALTVDDIWPRGMGVSVPIRRLGGRRARRPPATRADAPQRPVRTRLSLAQCTQAVWQRASNSGMPRQSWRCMISVRLR